MKFFKVACLAYTPSKVEYRGILLDRSKIIEIRRGLIERIEVQLPKCDLFKVPANYPRRYFDDLIMLDGSKSESNNKVLVTESFVD
jgi:hypothetical protein